MNYLFPFFTFISYSLSFPCSLNSLLTSLKISIISLNYSLPNFNINPISHNYHQPTKINSLNLLNNSYPFLLNGYHQNPNSHTLIHKISQMTHNRLYKSLNKKEHTKSFQFSSTLRKTPNQTLSIKSFRS